MKPKACIIFLLCLVVSFLSAEDWKINADFNLSGSQNSYSNNWTGSELSNISWVASTNSSAEKQLSRFFNSKSTLKLAYGQTYTQKKDASGDKSWGDPEKTTDKIDFETVLKFTLQTWVDPFIAGKIESQFIDQRDTLKTRLFNPALFTESAGISRTIIATELNNVSTRLGAALRQNVDRNAIDPEDAPRRTTLRTNDGGLEFVAESSKIFKPSDIVWKSRLQCYQALFNSKSKTIPAADWKALDVAWQNTLTAKLYKALSLNFALDVLYDRELDHDVRFKESLALGLSLQLL